MPLNLATLPIDVLEPVVAGLGKDDVKSLTLTCRSLRAVALPGSVRKLVVEPWMTTQSGVAFADAERRIEFLRTQPTAAPAGTRNACTYGSFVRDLEVELNFGPSRPTGVKPPRYAEPFELREAKTARGKAFSVCAPDVAAYLTTLARILVACPNLHTLYLLESSFSDAVLQQVIPAMQSVIKAAAELSKLKEFRHKETEGVGGDCWYELLLPHLAPTLRTLHVHTDAPVPTLREPAMLDHNTLAPNYSSLKTLIVDPTRLVADDQPLGSMLKRQIARSPNLDTIKLVPWTLTDGLLRTACAPARLTHLHIGGVARVHYSEETLSVLQYAPHLTHVTLQQIESPWGISIDCILPSLPLVMEVLDLDLPPPRGSYMPSLFKQLAGHLADASWAPKLRALDIGPDFINDPKLFRGRAALRPQLDQALLKGKRTVKLSGWYFRT